jgi:hypothetical protein
MIHHERWLCPGKWGRIRLVAVFPTDHTSQVPSPTPMQMSIDQRASERVGELIHHAFNSLLQATTDLERLQDLIGLGVYLQTLLAPHSQAMFEFMVLQEQRFRENWDKFLSVMEAAESSVSRPQQPAPEAIEPPPGSLPVIAVQVADEVALPTQTKV